MRGTIRPLALILLLAGLLAGCATPPVELKYRCVLPNNLTFDIARDLAGLFATEIASKAHLQVLNQTRLTGKTPNDVTNIVSLKSTADDKVFVNVLFNRPYRTIAMTISGDIRDPEANLIAQRAIDAFSKLFPGSNLAPFAGNQALFGP
jgi:hypothetical protein